MKIAIHQPNFMPWFPFFQKINNCDLFVLLVNCQYEAHNYQNRFNVGNTWYTMSVDNSNRHEHILTKKYVNPKDDWDTIKRKFLSSNRPEYVEIMSEMDDLIDISLSLTNHSIIKKICEILDIKTKIILDEKTNLTKTDRLIEICQKNNATTYLSGLGGRNYLNLDLFEKNGINIEFQNEDTLIKEPILETIRYVRQANNKHNSKR